MAQTPEMFIAGVAGVSEQRISFVTWKGLNHIQCSRSGWVYIFIKHHLITVSDVRIMSCKVVEEYLRNSHTLDGNAFPEEVR
jgi:hypothetical protein